MILIILSVSLGYSGLAAQGGGEPPPDRLMIPASLFDKAVACIKSFEGWHYARHYPYIGYGHKLLPGEKLTCNLTKAQADSLLRADLIKRCSTFRRFGKDALILRYSRTMWVNTGCWVPAGYRKAPLSANWSPATERSIRSISAIADTRADVTPVC